MTGSLLIGLGATVFAIRPDSPRDREVPSLALPAKEPLRITFLGTSLSAPGRYIWPDEVGSRVSGLIGHPVVVHRVTRPGADSTWGATQTDAVLATHADVVVIEFAINDADVRHHMTVADSVAEHAQILTNLGAASHAPVVILMTMNPAAGPRAWVRPFLSRYYAEYVGLSERHNTGLVDMYARWLELPDDRRDLVDGLHPSDTAASRAIVGPLADSVAHAVRASAG